MILSIPSRVVLLSSIMATLTMRHSIEAKTELDHSAVTDTAFNFTYAAELLHSLLHTHEAITPRRITDGLKTASIIGDRDRHLFPNHCDFHMNFSRAGMADDIIQSFLKGKKNRVTQLGSHRIF